MALLVMLGAHAAGMATEVHHQAPNDRPFMPVATVAGGATRRSRAAADGAAAAAASMAALGRHGHALPPPLLARPLNGLVVVVLMALTWLATASAAASSVPYAHRRSILDSNSSSNGTTAGPADGATRCTLTWTAAPSAFSLACDGPEPLPLVELRGQNFAALANGTVTGKILDHHRRHPWRAVWCWTG